MIHYPEIEKFDSEVYHALINELERQERNIELIAPRFKKHWNNWKRRTKLT